MDIVLKLGSRQNASEGPCSECVRDLPRRKFSIYFMGNWLEWSTGVVIVVLAASLSYLAIRYLRPGRTVNPFQIHLVGVRPDEGDQLYDPAGQPCGTELYSEQGRFWWPSNKLCRDFIFEWSGARLQPRQVFLEVELARHQTMRALTHLYPQAGGRQRLVAQALLPTVVRRRFLRFRGGERPVRHVNLKLWFYDQNDPDHLARFQAPFPCPPESQTISGVTLTTGLTDSNNLLSLRLQLTAPPGSFPDRFPFVLVLDRQGTSRAPARVSQRRGPNGQTIELEMPGVSLPEVAEIRLLKAHQAEFFNVTVQYPNRSRRHYPEYCDAVAARMGITNRPLSATSFPLHDPKEIMPVLDLLRGPLIRKAHATLQSHAARARRSSANAWQFLTPTNQLGLRRTAWRWAHAATPTVRLAGVDVGLAGNWPEFIPPAKALLYLPDPSLQRKAAILLAPQSEAFTATEMPGLETAILQCSDPATTDALIQCAANQSNVATRDTLQQLAECDDIRVWWRVLAMVSADTWGDAPSTKAALQGRWWLVRGQALPRADSQAALDMASQVLNQCFQPDLLKRDPGLFLKLYQALIDRMPPDLATPALLAFLERPTPSEDTSGIRQRIIQQLNLWHGTNQWRQSLP